MSLRLPTRTLAPVLVLAVLGGIVATFMVARPPSSAGDETPSLVRPKLAQPAPVKKPKAKAKTTAPVAKPKPAPAPLAKPAKPAEPPWTPTASRGCFPVRLPAIASSSWACTIRIRRSTRWRSQRHVQAHGQPAQGFVAINVFAESQSRPLLELLGALENPGILVYRKPDVLFARMSGFADSETVAQAAANARR